MVSIASVFSLLFRDAFVREGDEKLYFGFVLQQISEPNSGQP